MEAGNPPPPPPPPSEETPARQTQTEVPDSPRSPPRRRRRLGVRSPCSLEGYITETIDPLAGPRKEIHRSKPQLDVLVGRFLGKLNRQALEHAHNNKQQAALLPHHLTNADDLLVQHEQLQDQVTHLQQGLGTAEAALSELTIRMRRAMHEGNLDAAKSELASMSLVCRALRKIKQQSDPQGSLSPVLADAPHQQP